MCRKDKQKQAIAALPLNVVTFVSFVLPRTNPSAATLSGWGFNLLALVQLVMIGILLFRLVNQLRTRS